MPTIPINSASLFVALTKAATLFTNAMFARTRSGYPHTKAENNRVIYSIEDSTRIGAPTQSGNLTFIDIIIDLKKAPYAAAYEWGKDEPYQIPKEPGLVAFSRERWPQYKPPPDVQFFAFTQVTHKKIEAKPFLRPTIEAKRREITALIGKEFKEMYIRSIGDRRVEIK
jgi:hypothetical protein